MIGKIHPIPAFTDNYIWAIHCSESDHVCIVDPGDANVVQEYLNLNKLQLTDILVTHHHPDHTGGLMQLKKDHKPRIIGPKSSGIDGITDFVTENDSIELFDCKGPTAPRAAGPSQPRFSNRIPALKLFVLSFLPRSSPLRLQGARCPVSPVPTGGGE